MVEAYQIHATLQVLAFTSMLTGVYRARRHKMRTHHGFIYITLTLTTLAVALMINESGGLPTVHGKFGFSVYLAILMTALSGKLFFGKKITRNQHKFPAFLAMFLLLLMILHGAFTFVF